MQLPTLQRRSTRSIIKSYSRKWKCSTSRIIQYSSYKFIFKKHETICGVRGGMKNDETPTFSESLPFNAFFIFFLTSSSSYVYLSRSFDPLCLSHSLSFSFPSLSLSFLLTRERWDPTICKPRYRKGLHVRLYGRLAQRVMFRGTPAGVLFTSWTISSEY